MGSFIKNISNWCYDRLFWIDPNIRNLKSKFKENNVLVQYTPPKWLSPSEVWIIYYRSFKASNINSMVYKWAHEWVVSLKDEWNYLKLKFLKSLEESAPEYELSYWQTLVRMRTKYKINSLWMRYWDVDDTNDFVFKKWFNTFQNKLLDYCIEKWWLKKTRKWQKFYGIIPLFLLILFSKPALTFTIFIILSVIIWSIVSLRKDEIFCPWNIELTEEWEKVFSEIYWYKYFLEHCEEEKLKKIIEEDPDFIDKTLPYAVALRLNVDFLKYSISCFSTLDFDIDISELKLDK